MSKALPAALLALCCLACTPPIYDPDVRAEAATLESIPAIAAAGPLAAPDLNDDGKPDFDVATDEFILMPERAAAGAGIAIPTTGIITQGFVVRTDEWDWTNLWYFWPSTSGGTAWLQPTGGYPAGTSGVPAWQPVSLKSGSSLGAVYLEPYSSASWLERYVPDTVAQSWSRDTLDVVAAAVLLGVSGPTVAGLSVNARSTPAQDRLDCLVRDSSQRYLEGYADVSSSTASLTVMGTNGPAPYALSQLPGGGHVVYLRDNNVLPGRSFAQVWSWDGWHTYAWWGPGSAAPTSFADLPAVDHRIDAVLSTGTATVSYLFSTEDQVGRVYSFDQPTSAAALVAQFPLGTLRFIGEVYHLGKWKLVFSRCIVDGGNLRFQIRAIDTALVATTFAVP